MRKRTTVWRTLLVLELTLALSTLATAREARAETYIGDIIKVTSQSGSDCYYQFAMYTTVEPLVEKILARQNSGSCNVTWEVTADGLCMTRSTNPSQTNFCDSSVTGYNTWSYSSYDSGWNTVYGAPNAYYMSFTPSSWPETLSTGFRINGPAGSCDVFGTGESCTIHIQGAQTYTLTRPYVPLGARGNLKVRAASSECTTAIYDGSTIQVDPGCVLNITDVANPTNGHYTVCRQGLYDEDCTDDPNDLAAFDSGEYGLVYVYNETPELAADGCVIAYNGNGSGYDEVERYDISGGSSGDDPVAFDFVKRVSTPDYFTIVLDPAAGQPYCW